MMDDLVDDVCDTDLHIAVRLGDIGDVRQALREGYHPNTIGLYEWNSLHEASSEGHFSILKLLLEHGGNPNVPDVTYKNTALHYACLGGHFECVETLLKAGADGNVLNGKNQSPCDLTRDSKCKELLSQYGYVSKKKAIKSILKSTNQAKKLSQPVNEISKPFSSSTSARTKPSKVIIENQTLSNDTEDLPSPTSVDSGRFSAIQKTPTKLNWETSSDGLLQLPASPARSIGSSYGSMTSLGSSGCSVADDCAGHFVLSFQYNRKTEEFKIRLWEARLITLLPPSKMPKDTSIHMYIGSNFITEGEFAANPALKKKSEVFRLHPGEQQLAEAQCLSESLWNEREARLEFKSSVSVEYSGVSKQLVDASSVQISLCIQRRRSILSSKKSSVYSDPVLASVEVEMREAVRKLMKESYDTARHEVLGITRPAIPLDGVITDSTAYENRSFISDSAVHVHVSSLADSTNHVTRSSSVGDLKSSPNQLRSATKSHNQSHRVIDVSCASRKSVDRNNKETNSKYGKSRNYSTSPLETVVSHLSPANSEVRVSVPRKKSSHKLSSVATGKENTSDSNVKLSIPHSNTSVYQDLKRNEKVEDNIGHKARNKLKSGRRSLLSNASTMLHPGTTVVTSLDDEERSMGSPSEEVFQADENFQHECRQYSSSSFVEVDESPTRHPPRRTKQFLRSPQLSPQRKTTSNTSTKSRHCTLEIEARNTDHDIELGPISGTSNTSRSPLKLHEKSEMKSKNPSGTLSASRLQAKSRDKKQQAHRDHALKRLIFDETNVDDIPPASSNPGYVND